MVAAITGYELPKQITTKSDAPLKKEDIANRIHENAKKWMAAADKIQDFGSKCFTWGVGLPCSAFLVGLVVAMFFPHFAIGAAAGTAAVFVLGAIAWGTVYLVGAILVGISYAIARHHEKNAIAS
jgi:hypothetical protein